MIEDATSQEERQQASERATSRVEPDRPLTSGEWIESLVTGKTKRPAAVKPSPPPKVDSGLKTLRDAVGAGELFFFSADLDALERSGWLDQPLTNSLLWYIELAIEERRTAAANGKLGRMLLESRAKLPQIYQEKDFLPLPTERWRELTQGRQVPTAHELQSIVATMPALQEFLVDPNRIFELQGISRR